jgi:hypothetical protein
MPAGLERVVGDVQLIIGSGVLAENQLDLVGDLLRVRSSNGEDSSAEGESV